MDPYTTGSNGTIEKLESAVEQIEDKVHSLSVESC